MAGFGRLALGVGIAEQPLLRGFVAALGEANDDAMDCCAAGPDEGAVGEGDFEAYAKDQRPELGHLFSLHDRVGRDEGDARIAACDIARGLEEPGGDIVQRTAAAGQGGEAADLGALRLALIFRADEGWIAKDEGAVLRRDDMVPVQFQCVAVTDAGGFHQRDAGIMLAEILGQTGVGDMVGHPQRHLRDHGGKFVDFDAEEMIDIQFRESGDIHDQFDPAIDGEQFAQYVAFQFAQLAIGDDQEIARTAGGVEERHRPQPVMQRAQGAFAAGLERRGAVELGTQIVQEQGFDDLEYRLFGGVVRALLAPRHRVDHAFEQRPEYGGRDVAPVEQAGVEQHRAHGSVEAGHGDAFAEQFAIDIGKVGEICVEALLSPVGRGVERLEQFAQPAAKVAAIGAGALFEEGQELVLALENAGIVGKEDEEQADEQPFQIMADIAVGSERIVQAAHQFRRLAVDRRLVAEEARLDADDEAESFDMAFEIREREAPFAAGFEVHQFETLKIAHHHVAGALHVGQPVIIIERLGHGAGEVATGAFLFHDQRAGPEQVDETPGSARIERFYPLFIDRHLPARHAEDAEEIIVETVGLALLIALALPFGGEMGRVRANFRPAEPHWHPPPVMMGRVDGAAIRTKQTLRRYGDSPIWSKIVGKIGADFSPL